MKILLSFSILSLTLCQAQEKIFEQSLSVFEGVNAKLCIENNDPDTSFDFTMFLKNSIRQFRINSTNTTGILIAPDSNLSYRFTDYKTVENPVTRFCYGHDYLGRITTDNSREFIFYNKNKNALSCLSITANQPTPELKDLLSLDENEVLVTSFISKNTFYAFSYLKESNKMHLYSKQPGQEIKKLEKIVTLPELGKIIDEESNFRIKKFSDLFSVDYFVFSDELSYPVSAGEIKVKLFIQQDKLVLLVNHGVADCYLMNIYLRDLEVSGINIHFADPTASSWKHNYGTSFVIDTTLLCAFSNGTTMELNCYNEITGAFYRKYSLKIPEVKVTKKDAVTASVVAGKYHREITITCGISVKEFTQRPGFILGAVAAGVLLNPVAGQTLGLSELLNRSKTYRYLEEYYIDGQKELVNKAVDKSRLTEFIKARKLKESDCFFYETPDLWLLSFYDLQQKKYFVYKFYK